MDRLSGIRRPGRTIAIDPSILEVNTEKQLTFREPKHARTVAFNEFSLGAADWPLSWNVPILGESGKHFATK